MNTPEQFSPDNKAQVYVNNKEDGYNYRERRQLDWRENYTLARDRVIINRLTQRQSVNLPVMKMVIQTLLKDVDDMPVLYFENLDNNKEAETFKNEYWKIVQEQNNMDLQDIVDKRQVFYFGRSFDQWQIVDGMVKMTVQDPEDILVSRYTNPYDLHSSRFLIHDHIFIPLSVLKANKDYDQKKIARLERWYKTQNGLIKLADNKNALEQKNERMNQMGLSDADSPIFGEVYVECALHFHYDRQEGSDYEELFLDVLAENLVTLMSKPLEQVIGVTSDHFWRNHYPYVSWADQLERQDFWSDAIADIVRPANKVLNAWYSQEVENRTLANMGMHFYDGTAQGAENFQPQTWQPQPFGWYKVPGDPNTFMKRVDVAPLQGNLDAMQFVMSFVEKATGATSGQQGEVEERQVTLGEVQLALGQAKERIKGMAKFYTPAWKQRGLIFIKLLEAAGDKLDAVKIYKKGRNTDNLYEREISFEDWRSEAGYRCRVWSQDERDAKNTESLQKADAVKANMPDNPVVDAVYKRKLLEFGDYTPDEVNEAMRYEEEKRAAAMMQQQMMGQPPMQPGTSPMQPPIQPVQQPQAPANGAVVDRLKSLKAQIQA